MSVPREDDRPLLFAPNRQDGAPPPVFYLHIPKTSGSSNNAFLRAIYRKNFREHVEYALPDLLARKHPALEDLCLSGHVPLWAWMLYRGSDAFERVTILRDPWARLVSHVNWVNLFNHGVSLPRHGPGAAALRRIVALVAQTDFEKVGDLRRLMNAVKKETYFTSWDNYQVRMLRTGRMDAMEKQMEDADLGVACTELRQFLHVGFCEEQADFQTELSIKLGCDVPPMPIVANRGRAQILCAHNSLAREVFAPWLELDQGLYGFARGAFATGKVPARAAA